MSLQDAAGKKDTGYWRWLLVAGGIMTLAAGLCLAGYEHGDARQVVLAGATYTLTQRSNGWLDAALFFGGVGECLFIPGLIGWGIHASGLTRDPLPARPSPFVATLADAGDFMDADGL